MVIAESGFRDALRARTPERRRRSTRVLIGETIMRAPDLELAARALTGVEPCAR